MTVVESATVLAAALDDAYVQAVRDELPRDVVQALRHLADAAGSAVTFLAGRRDAGFSEAYPGAALDAAATGLVPLRDEVHRILNALMLVVDAETRARLDGGPIRPLLDRAWSASDELYAQAYQAAERLSRQESATPAVGDPVSSSARGVVLPGVQPRARVQSQDRSGF